MPRVAKDVKPAPEPLPEPVAAPDTDESVVEEKAESSEPHAKIRRMVNKKKWSAAKQRRNQVRAQRERDVNEIIKPSNFKEFARKVLPEKRFADEAFKNLRDIISEDVLALMRLGVYTAGRHTLTPEVLAQMIILRDPSSALVPTTTLQQRARRMTEGL